MFHLSLWLWSYCMFVFQRFRNVAVVRVLWVCKSPALTLLHVEFQICTFSKSDYLCWEFHGARLSSGNVVFVFEMENYTLHILGWLILTLVNELCVNVCCVICGCSYRQLEKSACSHSRSCALACFVMSWPCKLVLVSWFCFSPTSLLWWMNCAIMFLLRHLSMFLFPIRNKCTLSLRQLFSACVSWFWNIENYKSCCGACSGHLGFAFLRTRFVF